MTKIQRKISNKEQKLLDIISDAKSKLEAIQEQQKIELGELAYKNGLNGASCKIEKTLTA